MEVLTSEACTVTTKSWYTTDVATALTQRLLNAATHMVRDNLRASSTEALHAGSCWVSLACHCQVQIHCDDSATSEEYAGDGALPSSLGVKAATSFVCQSLTDRWVIQVGHLILAQYLRLSSLHCRRSSDVELAAETHFRALTVY